MARASSGMCPSAPPPRAGRVPRTRLAIGLVAVALLAGGCAWLPGRRASAPSDTAELRTARDRRLADIRDEDGPTIRISPEAPPEPGDLQESARGPKPDWVSSGFSARFPASQYMLGMGSAREADAGERAFALADRRARAALAKEVRVRIVGEFQSVAETAAAEGRIEKDATEVYERLASDTDIELAGVAIVDRWRDPRGGVWWSLAALDRRRHARGLAERARALRAKLERDSGLALDAQELGGVRQLRRVNVALADALELARIRAHLAALGAEPGDRGDVERLADLWRASEAIRSDMPVGLVVFGDPVGAEGVLAARLSSAVAGMGFPAVAFDPGEWTLDALRTASAETLGQRFPGVSLLAAAEIEATETGHETLGRLRLVFYEAKGRAVVLDTEEGALVAASAIEDIPLTRHGNRLPERARDAALRAAAEQLTDALRRDTAEALVLP